MYCCLHVFGVDNFSLKICLFLTYVRLQKSSIKMNQLAQVNSPFTTNNIRSYKIFNEIREIKLVTIHHENSFNGIHGKMTACMIFTMGAFYTVFPLFTESDPVAVIIFVLCCIFGLDEV